MMHPTLTQKWFAALLALTLWFTPKLQAQFFPGQGGFGGQGAFGGNRGRTSTSGSYPGNSEVGDAVISIDPETRSLIVIADERTRQYISQVVSNLDRPKPQVLIKVVFIELTHNNSSDIGIEGGWAKNMGNSTTGAVANAFGMSGIASSSNLVNVFGQPVSSFQPMPPGAGLYQILSQDYQVTLRAIAQSGKAKLLSRPSIVARNNQPATITVGQSVPLTTSVRFDNFGNAINNVQYQSVGIILRVTPFITSDGMVEMIVSPETSDLVADRSQWVPISTGALAPVINTRSADTVVVTPDGQTVIIGGLMANVKSDSESKIPLLGDIPLLGNLFKRKTKTDNNTEVLIFLTPYIIQAPSQMAALSAREQEKSGLKKNLTEQELNKFLDTLPAAQPPAAPSKSKQQSSGSSGK